MTIFACLGGFFLLGYYTLGRSLGLVAGAVSSIAFVLLLTSSQQFDYLIFVHHFGTSSAIGLLGLILLARWSASESAWTFAGGLACIVVANWINPGVAFALAPLLVRAATLRCRDCLGRRRRGAGHRIVADFLRDRATRFVLAEPLAGGSLAACAPHAAGVDRVVRDRRGPGG